VYYYVPLCVCVYARVCACVSVYYVPLCVYVRVCLSVSVRVTGSTIAPYLATHLQIAIYQFNYHIVQYYIIIIINDIQPSTLLSGLSPGRFYSKWTHKNPCRIAIHRSTNYMYGMSCTDLSKS